MKAKGIWIIGAGRFGQMAAQHLGNRHLQPEITVVDQNRQACRRMEASGFKAVCQDGIDFLGQHLKAGTGPDWIVPAVPLHVAFEWVRRKLAPDFDVNVLAVPEHVVKVLPGALRGPGQAILISYATFVCPLDCAEPLDLCSHTGEPRPGILHNTLASLTVDGFISLVIQSRQLGPGIGGYAPKALFEVLAASRVSRGPVLLSTACRCHGILHAFELKAK